MFFICYAHPRLTVMGREYVRIPGTRPAVTLEEAERIVRLVNTASGNGTACIVWCE